MAYGPWRRLTGHLRRPYGTRTLSLRPLDGPVPRRRWRSQSGTTKAVTDSLQFAKPRPARPCAVGKSRLHRRQAQSPAICDGPVPRRRWRSPLRNDQGLYRRPAVRPSRRIRRPRTAKPRPARPSTTRPAATEIARPARTRRTRPARPARPGPPAPFARRTAPRSKPRGSPPTTRPA